MHRNTTDRNRGGSTSRGRGEWARCSLAEMAHCDWERVAIKGLGGEGQNAQMQDCYVLYHENGTTLAINH